ncbi:cystinosin-like protein [Leptotrombidium deliense]|uniref:Cystinosin-like protein n=1 Tax=Leptotrombidium deliense TaxID=299467 RepID=A0A443SCT0_9ACAR|nr:cystinosin-like protein [Leptotrombidium deliense]
MIDVDLFDEPINEETPVRLICKGSKCATIYGCTKCSNFTLYPNSTNAFQVVLKTSAVGVTTWIANTTNKNVDFSSAFRDVSVGFSSRILLLSNIVGWIYFVAWSISFYPQVWTNFSRKSVVGLNFDFLALNLTGFIFYSLFNVCLFFISSFRNEYRVWKPFTQVPVELNDVVFSLHAVLLTSVTICQCFLFDRGGQRVSIIAWLILLCLWSAAGVLLILVLTNLFSQLYFVLYFSYAKLGITVFKYTPQALHNFRRRSTEGWSIGNVLLDFTGGSFSILQMFLLSYNYDDWSNIFGNFTKFGLGMVSIMFDILFIIQHYVLYRNTEESATLIQSKRKNSNETVDIDNNDENRIIS